MYRHNGLIGLGETLLPADLTPVTKADLETRLEEQQAKYVKGAVLIGAGVVVLAVAAAMASRLW